LQLRLDSHVDKERLESEIGKLRGLKAELDVIAETRGRDIEALEQKIEELKGGVDTALKDARNN